MNRNASLTLAACLIVFTTLLGCSLQRSADGPRSTTPATTAPIEQPAERSMDLLEEASRLLDLGDLRGAERVYRRVIARQPDAIAGRIGLGRLYLRQQNYALAETAFEGALKLDADAVDALIGLGIVSDERGQHEAASARYREALVREPDDVDALNNLGFSRYLAGDLPAARAALEDALSIDANHPQASANLALVRVVDGDDTGAQRALERVGNRSQALNNMGYLSLLQGRQDEARDAFREALDVSDGVYGAAVLNLGRNEVDPSDRILRAERASLGLDAYDGRVRASSAGATVGEPSDEALRDRLTAAATERTRETSIFVDDAPLPASSADETLSRSPATESDADPESTNADEPVRPLRRELIRTVQTNLSDRGFEVGEIDGRYGTNTTRAVRLFKVARRLPVTDDITYALLSALGIDAP